MESPVRLRFAFKTFRGYAADLGNLPGGLQLQLALELPKFGASQQQILLQLLHPLDQHQHALVLRRAALRPAQQLLVPGVVAASGIRRHLLFWEGTTRG